MQTSPYAPIWHRVCGVSLPTDSAPVQIDGCDNNVTALVWRCVRLIGLAGESHCVTTARLFNDARIPTGTGRKTRDRRHRTIRWVRSGVVLMHHGHLDPLRE
jgi:hypothetical protein